MLIIVSLMAVNHVPSFLMKALGSFPVIETQLVRSFLDKGGEQVQQLQLGDEPLLIKPMDGADSIGQKILTITELARLSESDTDICDNYVVQRVVEFDFEVSFYFVNGSFVYALRTGGLGSQQQRWQLSPYTQELNRETWEGDMEFAARFNAWNGSSRGVVRVDGVRESKTKKPVTPTRCI